MAKKTGGKAGENDVPRDVREGRAVENTEKAINRANQSGKSTDEKLRDLLR